MKKILPALFILPFLSLGYFASAQYNSAQNKVWAISSLYGLDFRNGDPEPITTGYYTSEGGASLADNDGIVFCSNGTYVWNKNNQMMPHGNLINGIANMSMSSSQASVIAPFLNTTDSIRRYYLFTLSQIDFGCKLFCNVIDMTLDGGLGDIDTNFYLRHIPIDSNLCEKMIVVPGCNGNLWLMVHEQNSIAFKAYEITSTGINLTPVISYAGHSTNYVLGVMKTNPQCNKLITCNPGGIVELYDLDNITGTVSNAVKLDSLQHGYYSGAFSPDGTKVYARDYFFRKIYQFDLNDPSPASTKTFIGNSGASSLSDIQLGPDGKIYFFSFYSSDFNGSSYYMGRINYPNNTGAACGYQDTVSTLAFSGFGLRGGLSNTYFEPEGSSQEIITSRDSLVCPFPAGGLVLRALSSPGYLWNDGSTGPTLTVTQAGTYWVRRKTAPCTYTTDTIKVKGNTPEAVIVLNNNTLSTTQTYNFYQWYKNGIAIPNSNGQYCTATGPGWYSVKVNGPDGCSDSTAYQIGNGTSINNLDKSKIIVSPNPARDKVYIQSPIPLHVSLYNIEGKKLMEERQKPELDVRHIAEGLYFLRMNDQKGNLIQITKLVIHRRG